MSQKKARIATQNFNRFIQLTQLYSEPEKRGRSASMYQFITIYKMRIGWYATVNVPNYKSAEAGSVYKALAIGLACEGFLSRNGID